MRPVPLLVLWIAAGLALSELTGRVRDWFDMTDELRYERLALSIARTHSLVPRIHGVEVKSFEQLYPLLIAPLFAHGPVPHDVVQAHVLNAWVMASACIPAYLLAHAVTRRRLWGYVVAVLSVCMPWIVYSTMLMTEVAAYPAFVWALLALYYATARPTVKGDLVALVGLAVAIFARTEFLALVFVLPAAIIAFEIGSADDQPFTQRVIAGLRSSVRGHRVLTIACGAAVIGAIVLTLARSLTTIVGVYGAYTHPITLVSPARIGPIAAHVALYSLGFGVLPFLAGAAWLFANVFRVRGTREQHAFACVAAVTTAILFLVVTNFDVTQSGGFQVMDRYLLYLTPLILIGMCCAIDGILRPRWSLLAVASVTVCGFATGAFPAWQRSGTLATDSPMSGLLEQIVRRTHTLTEARVFLAVATVVLTTLFLAGTIWLSRRALAVAMTVFAVIALPAITAATFQHLFGAPSWSGRPLTAPDLAGYDWIDGDVGPNAQVSLVPYLISSDYFVSEQTFRDLEFWNKAVVRDLQSASGAYAYTGIWFPKTDLRINPETGVASVSPTPWVLMSDKETRFALVGNVRYSVGDLRLVEAPQPWRAQWVSFGLYGDGWTRPGVTARIRIFPTRRQRRPVERTFTFALRAPDSAVHKPVRITSNLDSWTGTATHATLTTSIAVCVPPRGYTEIRVSTPASSTIPPDLAALGSAGAQRRGGVFFGEAALAGEIGGTCRAAPEQPRRDR
jgi:hypothetical protein